MRILVTGHSGYIGTVMVPMLQAEGHEIVGFDSDLFEKCTFGGPIPNVPNVRKDIRDIEVSDLEGFDAVVHLAALSTDPVGDLNPEITYSINYEASVNLAKLAKRVGVQHFLFSSSCSIYGTSGEDIVTEETEPHPITPYAISKVRAEEGISKLADSRFSPTFLRCATAYGISPKLRFDLVLNNLVAWAYTTGIVRLKSDGTPWRPIIHIEDISRAFIAILNAPRDLVHNQVFNVGITEENYQVRELADIVKETVPGSRVEYAKDAAPDKLDYRVDCSKLTQTLSEFRPQWNASLGAKQLYTAYQKVGLTSTEEFEGPRYKRIEHLRKLINTGRLDTTLRWRAVEHG